MLRCVALLIRKASDYYCSLIKIGLHQCAFTFCLLPSLLIFDEVGKCTVTYVFGMSIVVMQEVNGKEVQIQITGFMEKNTGKFMKELWSLLLSAQKNASGVPQQFLDAKEEELRKKKVHFNLAQALSSLVVYFFPKFLFPLTNLLPMIGLG